VDALDLIMLGRQLTKIGEAVLRRPGDATGPGDTADRLDTTGRAGAWAGGTSGSGSGPVMPNGPSLVLRDVFAHPGSSITDITGRTGLPQSYVSESVARLRDQGIVETAADPADGRRTLVRVSAGHPRTVAAKGMASVDAALAEALGEPEGGAAEIIETLERLAARLRPASPGPIRRRLDQARGEL
jgi:DNA-binding MarR family transcriptional regulator